MPCAPGRVTNGKSDCSAGLTSCGRYGGANVSSEGSKEFLRWGPPFSGAAWDVRVGLAGGREWDETRQFPRQGPPALRLVIADRALGGCAWVACGAEICGDLQSREC